MAIIETERLTKHYGSRRGIRDVTLEVREGEVFGLLGPNGAGKTTLIRTLLDLLRPTEGSARLFGLDSRRDSVEIRRRLGNLPGDFACDPRYTGRDLLEVLSGLRGMDGLGRAEALAERFSAELDAPVGHLSRGNTQKIGLIQALFHQPGLLILDEPTGGLDPLMQEEFIEVVGEESAAGRTVFVSSHDLSEVERVCDRVAIIREGRLIAVESVQGLLDRTYRRAEIEFADPVDPAEFSSLDGVAEMEAHGNTLTFKVTGNLDGVVKAAARHPLVDLRLAHPSLEEVFLSYYEDDGE
jgi:beta-exotoxin I transport system ATP-binding protein